MLEEILSDENIETALENLKAKNDSGGADGMRLSALEEYISLNKRELKEAIIYGDFRPGIVQETEILQKSGKRRVISKLNSIDRLILRAMHQVLYKHLSGKLSAYSFAYRENIGIPDMIEVIREYVSQNYKYVIELDIEDFFDNISHEKMLEVLRERIDDSRVINLISLYMKTEIERDGVISVKDKGLIQGSSLSPLLSNLYLDSFDSAMEHIGIKFVRFCDDIRLFAANYEDAVNIYTVTIIYT